jgi:branched-chain amino acid transport system substrate-binding protein
MVMAQAKPAPAKEPAKAPAKPAATPAAAKEPIKIGAIYDLAGPCYMYSDSAIHGGIRIAIDEINAKGGIKSMGGAKLKLLLADTEAKEEVKKNIIICPEQYLS